MAERIEEEKTLNPNGTKSVKTTTTQDGEVAQSKPALAARIVWYVAGVLLTLLAIRFVFVLLGANEGNGFVDFIYSVTYPFVVPFFGIFNYELEAGVSSLEIATLVAMLIYGVVAAGIANILTIKHRD